jgi:cohesin loading factor subunit SCC2
VGSAIVQRYINTILHAALSSDDDIQKVAIDILSLTINQGLAHPIQVNLLNPAPDGRLLTTSLSQSFPIIVTLETSDSLQVSEKAFGLHSHLQAKHASIINSRYFESAKVVFDHRKSMDPNALGKLFFPICKARKRSD